MNPANLKIETIEDRSPKGGQHCGVLPRGVKITHVPTGLEASCSAERSQTLNKSVAMAMIEWGLVELDVIDRAD